MVENNPIQERTGTLENKVLFLISEELKSRKLFHILRKAGLDHSYYQPHLDNLILSLMGLDPENDSTFDFYYQQMEKRCKRIKANPDSIRKQSIRIYEALQKFLHKQRESYLL